MPLLNQKAQDKRNLACESCHIRFNRYDETVIVDAKVYHRAHKPKQKTPGLTPGSRRGRETPGLLSFQAISRAGPTVNSGTIQRQIR